MSESDRIKWEAIYERRRQAEVASLAPAELLSRVQTHLPRAGKALDLAGGSGRNAIWLARRGLDVTIADIAPTALELAQQSAAAAGINIETRLVDLDQALDSLELGGPFDLVIDFHFLDRSVLAAIDTLLAGGGVFVFCQPTVINLERHERPSRRFLLAEGELLGLLPSTLEVLHHLEDWSPEGRHEAELVARLPATSLPHIA